MKFPEIAKHGPGSNETLGGKVGGPDGLKNFFLQALSPTGRQLRDRKRERARP